MTMQNELKQFGAKVTEPLSGQFHSARARLTFIYVAILAIILLISSLVIFSSFSNRIQRRFRPTPPPGVVVRRPPPEFQASTNLPTPEQVQADLIQSLIIVNGLLLIGAGLFSYWLAGLTLLPIQSAYESQRRFLSDASHELRTPLAILQTDLENELSDRSIKKKEQAQAESHLEEVERMSNLVNDLLAISRIDNATTIENKAQAVNLVDSVALAVDRLENYAKKHAVTLTSFLPKEQMMIQAQSEQIIQAATNLIKNAIDYNKPKGKVTVKLDKQDNKAVFTVIDTGIGIPKLELTRLFDRFYRVDQSRSRASGGNGLGLAIVKAVADQYNGSIIIDSTPDKGTVATLTLPLS